MHFTQETDYALRLVDFFATHGGDGVHSARNLSERLHIPYRFLLRVLGKLKKGGIIASRQGSNGGYVLARPPGLVTLRQVVDAMEDGVVLSRCLGNTALCNAGQAPNCRVHRALLRLQERVNDMFDHCTFD